MSKEPQEAPVEEYTYVTIKTSMGDIELELFEKEMPLTVGNFLELAQADFYDGIKFHRVMPNFM
ncbi:MAG: peptidylprolyl isomerase, partial [Candidatus Pacebacteria bacterium]|nr:peptidylprolyl isomerase [Candidatus Paceibacterota bacterium]